MPSVRKAKNAAGKPVTPTKTLEEVVALLDLPTAEDVADLLRAHGVTGTPVATCSCPVSRFVAAQYGSLVSASRVCIIDRERSVDTPRAAADFILRFDNHDPAFADLVAP